MGAGILPTTIYKNKLYFLFGKENQYEDSARGFSDFGGGTDGGEDLLATACREASEELTGFLGGPAEIRAMLEKSGTYTIDYKTDGHGLYRMHIFHFPYNECLPFYYNNNQQFLQKHLDPAVIKRSKIFEKAEIAWFSLDEMMRRKSEFRHYFQNIVEIIHAQRDKIREFLRKGRAQGNRGTATAHKPHLNTVVCSSTPRRNRKTRRWGRRTRRWK